MSSGIASKKMGIQGMENSRVVGRKFLSFMQEIKKKSSSNSSNILL